VNPFAVPDRIACRGGGRKAFQKLANNLFASTKL